MRKLGALGIRCFRLSKCKFCHTNLCSAVTPFQHSVQLNVPNLWSPLTRLKLPQGLGKFESAFQPQSEHPCGLHSPLSFSQGNFFGQVDQWWKFNPFIYRITASFVKTIYAVTGTIGCSGCAGRPKKCQCKRVSLYPMIFSIRWSSLGPKNCHCSRILTLTGVTVTDRACFNRGDVIADVCSLSKRMWKCDFITETV